MLDSALQRSYDAEFLNSVLNHPEVSRWMIGFEPPYDLSSVLANPANVFLANAHGGFLFVADEERFKYEVHTQFLPEGRGSSLALARDAALYMFAHTACLAIETYVPHDNEAARRLTLAMGFVPCGDIEVNERPCTVYLLTIKTWARTLCQPQQ